MTGQGLASGEWPALLLASGPWHYHQIPYAFSCMKWGQHLPSLTHELLSGSNEKKYKNTFKMQGLDATLKRIHSYDFLVTTIMERISKTRRLLEKNAVS